MSKNLKRKLIIIESKLRVILFSFCVYSFIYALVFQLFPDYANNIVHNYFFIIVTSIFSFCGGLVLKEEIEELKKELGWSWEAETKWEYILTEYNSLIIIGAFYFCVQMGTLAIFFPSFDQVKIGSTDHHLYPYLFIFNSIVIYVLYRLTILKITLKEQSK